MTSAPPIKDTTIDKNNHFSTRWINWFTDVWRATSGQTPIQLKSYTVLTLPPADIPSLIYVSDATGGAIPAFSDGTNWRRVDTRAIIT